MNRELPGIQAGFRKGRGSRDQIVNMHWIIEQENSRNTSASLTTLKPLTVWITTNCGKFLNRWEYQSTLTYLLRNLCQGTTLELDMEQWTGSKLGKEYIKAVYCYLAYWIYMQSTSCKMPDWMKNKMKSRLQGDTSIFSDMQMIPPLWQKVKRN